MLFNESGYSPFKFGFHANFQGGYYLGVWCSYFMSGDVQHKVTIPDDQSSIKQCSKWFFYTFLHGQSPWESLGNFFVGTVSNKERCANSKSINWRLKFQCKVIYTPEVRQRWTKTPYVKGIPGYLLRIHGKSPECRYVSTLEIPDGFFNGVSWFP